jgi:hypothetical protein
VEGSDHSEPRESGDGLLAADTLADLVIVSDSSTYSNVAGVLQKEKQKGVQEDVKRRRKRGQKENKKWSRRGQKGNKLSLAY